jgi:thiamine-monophosphate kinase
VDVKDLGEFGLIDRLAKSLDAPRDERLVVGIGDDAAVWRTDRRHIIATTDTMVAGVHFLPAKVSWKDVGWKALAVNVSDIAAMGGAPTFALVTLALPRTMRVEHVDAIYAGMRECAEVYGVTIAGGDVVSAPVMSITVALMGQAATGSGGMPLLLRRSAARPGDVVAVTAALGRSAGGLRALMEGTDRAHPELVQAHMHPWPRCDAGDIAVQAGITCGMDISDGLVQDLGHICHASGVGAVIDIDCVPVDEHLAAAYPADAREMAGTGGEDYELLLVGSEARIASADEILREHLAMPDIEQVTIVGRISDGPPGVRVLDGQGREVELTAGGWDHFEVRTL